MRRDWTEARAKVDAEGCRLARCRGHECDGPVEAAHVIPRSRGETLVQPDDIVPLCRHAHRFYDARQFDLLPYLTLDEQVAAVRAAGGIEAARKRTGGPFVR